VTPGTRRVLRELRGNLLAQGACAVVALLVVLAAFGPWLAPHDPEKFSLRERNTPPVFLEGGSWRYPLGTDPHGRDIASRIIHGTRVSLLTACSGVAIAVLLGLVFGMTAGYFGGMWDTVVMRTIDVLLSIPLILMALLVVAVLGPAISNIVLVMGGVGWIWHARIVRGNVLRIREEQYVLAAVNAGTAPSGILIRHVLPNLAAPVIVTATMQIGYMVILESGLSFFGITGSTLSWGWDIAFGRKYLGTAWWIASFPGLAIFVTVVSLNIVGDFLRDVIDPHGKERPLG